MPNIPNIKEDVEKKRIEAIQVKYREMSEEEVFSRFEGWIASKASRGGEELRKWKIQMTTLSERGGNETLSVSDRDEALKQHGGALNQLRMTLMLLENSNMRTLNQDNTDYWIETGMGILRSLNLNDKV